ncbi:uncharacterized protein [Sinocyclocheilus grahami]|uniref:uncharacterized protein n=1 Tax=Sinocyclocheilus grahami TaxID=75366 RepID=UPI0007AD1CDF|nr:PREDICTED: uncharacterized protein LOC107592507 [Sinocyclocheilus grahami]
MCFCPVHTWFCEDGNVEDPLEEQKTLKFRGDLAYRRKQFQAALDEYRFCLSLIPAGNISVKRDVLEGIARCCCHLGKKEEALNACEKLRTEVSNCLMALARKSYRFETCMRQRKLVYFLNVYITELHISYTTLPNIYNEQCQVMAEDLTPEKMREENQDGESLSGLYIKEFDDRWWNKLCTKMQEDTPSLSMHRSLEETNIYFYK